MKVSHATLGILGMGRIGLEVAKRAKGFSMKILYHNRSRNIEAEKEVEATYCDKETLFKESDFIVVVVPLSKETRFSIFLIL